MVVFRSVLVPIKAVIITCCRSEPLPFAIVIGPSMDDEVFLLSRVREEWRRTGGGPNP
jgi:hypothetical protein